MTRSNVVLGAADGLTILLGLLVSLSGQPHAIVRAAVGAGLAELVGMAAALWLSNGRAGFWPALSCGAASLAACVLPAVPYMAASGTPALAASLGIVLAVAGVIALLREENGFAALFQTYGVLAAAAALCWVASLA